MHNPRSVSSAFILAIVAAMAATMLAMVGAAPPASACSIAPARAEVSPSFDLRAGQAIKIAGWSFLSVSSSGGVVPPVTGSLTNLLPPDSCGDIEIVPMPAIAITWRGTQTQVIARATGPDFVVEARVPDFARAGRATIDVGGVAVQVTVGPKIDPPPPPCPLTPGVTTTNPAAATQPSIDCPPPCPLTAATTGANASAAAQYPCPEPCPVYATGSGTLTPAQDATRRPCPDPCAATDSASGAAIWCPDPCAVTTAGQDAAIWCPDPCNVTAAAQAVIRCPDPCPLYLGIEAGSAPAQASANASLRYCPPCGSLDAQAAALWCPNPCKPTDDDARPCVEPPTPAPGDPNGVAVEGSARVTGSGTVQPVPSTTAAAGVSATANASAPAAPSTATATASGASATATSAGAAAANAASAATGAALEATTSTISATDTSVSARTSMNITAGARSASAAVEMRAALVGCSRDECARIISAQTVKAARSFVLAFFGGR